MFCKKDIYKNFAKFTGKHLCQILLFNNVAGLRTATLLKRRLWHRCFSVNFEKFLRTLFYRIPPVDASINSPPQTFSKKKTMKFFFHGCLWLLLKTQTSELLPDLIMCLFPIVDNLYSKKCWKITSAMPWIITRDDTKRKSFLSKDINQLCRFSQKMCYGWTFNINQKADCVTCNIVTES